MGGSTEQREQQVEEDLRTAGFSDGYARDSAFYVVEFDSKQAARLYRLPASVSQASSDGQGVLVGSAGEPPARHRRRRCPHHEAVGWSCRSPMVVEPGTLACNRRCCARDPLRRHLAASASP